MRKLLLAILFFAVNSHSFAQERIVTGNVLSDVDSSPLPGVSVLLKGTSNATITDADGSFTLSVPPQATLVFSFIGYVTSEVFVGEPTRLEVKLTEDITQLSEVVVT